MRQSVYRSGSRSAAQARRLIAASQRPASFIVRATIEVPEYTNRSVVLCRSTEPLLIGTLFIPKGKQFFLVACTIAPERFYAVLAHNTREWVASIQDRDYAAMVIGKAQAFRNELLSQKEQVAA